MHGRRIHEADGYQDCWVKNYTVTLNTDIYSLNFLIEKIQKDKEKNTDIYYEYNSDVQGLLSSGLMYLCVIDGGGASLEVDESI